MKSILKTISFAAIGGCALAIASSAHAADPIIYEQPPVMMPAAMYDWSGFYAGVTGGYGWGDSDFSFDTGGGTTTGSLDLNGAFLGGVVGYNMQAGSWVFGVEGDLAWSGIDGSTTLGAGGETEVEWLGSVRGRVGYAWDNILPYVTGGVAFAHNEVSVPGFGSDSQTHIGWTAGVGVEVGLTQNVSASLEYRYSDFGDQDYTFNAPLTAEADGKLHTIGAALKWRFGM